MTWLKDYHGHQVVADLTDGYQVYGTLLHSDEAHLLFADADVHDQNEANSTKDSYAIETVEIGIRVNRIRCAVPLRRLLCISKLDEILQ